MCYKVLKSSIGTSLIQQKKKFPWKLIAQQEIFHGKLSNFSLCLVEEFLYRL